MTKPLRILYLRPASGGIADYADRIHKIYRGLGVELYQRASGESFLEASRKVDVVHFEIGAGDGLLLAQAVEIEKHSATKIIITIHDSGVVALHPFPVTLPTGNYTFTFLMKVYRKVINTAFGPSRIKQLLESPQVTIIYLRPDLADGRRSFYLPQPTYHDQAPAISWPSGIPRVGFAGYWAPAKGIETLVAAWAITKNKSELVLGGDTGTPDDPFRQAVRKLLAELKISARLPGFTKDSDFDSYITSLGVLVLPYWPELPSGTSAMAMRAAEHGVPIVASDTPALRIQLGDDYVTYVKPHDAQALASALDATLGDIANARKNAKLLQKLIFDEHSPEVVTRFLQEIITHIKA